MRKFALIDFLNHFVDAPGPCTIAVQLMSEKNTRL